MFQITSNAYNCLAQKLLDSINPTTIFSGAIEIFIDEVEIRFIATIIPFYTREYYSEGVVEVLHDIVPVWWELHTTTQDGEVMNDFDFETFKYLTCQQ
ncbi:MAG: hypothetical protein SNG10_05005 [Rikenellaceae bacterium]